MCAYSSHSQRQTLPVDGQSMRSGHLLPVPLTNAEHSIGVVKQLCPPVLNLILAYEDFSMPWLQSIIHTSWQCTLFGLQAIAILG